MANKINKQTLPALIVAIGVILIAIFAKGLYQPKTENSPTPIAEQKVIDPNQPTLLKTDPANLDGAIILPNQKILLFFSHPLENIPEMKYSFDPPVEGLIGKLSEDRKTATFSAERGFPVGERYKLTIRQDAKFDGGKHLDKQYDFEFKTIDYKGI